MKNLVLALSLLVSTGASVSYALTASETSIEQDKKKSCDDEKKCCKKKKKKCCKKKKDCDKDGEKKCEGKSAE